MTKKDQITEQELADIIFRTAVAKTILANQNALAHNEVLKRTPVFKSDIKEHGNKLILSLIRHERNEFNKIQAEEQRLYGEKGENPIDDAFEKSEKIINLLARMAFVDYEAIETTMYALAKDKNSVLGIAKKILR